MFGALKSMIDLICPAGSCYSEDCFTQYFFQTGKYKKTETLVLLSKHQEKVRQQAKVKEQEQQQLQARIRKISAPIKS